jgi:hypothetical protein
MKIPLVLVSLFMLSGSLQAGNVTPQQQNEVIQNDEIDDADPYGTGEVDDDIIIDEEEDSNDDEGVTPAPLPGK